MYTGLLHTHRLVVTIFLLIYVIKLGMMLFYPTGLERLRESKVARIAEMVVSVLFLATGIGLWTQTATPMANLLLVKVALVFASIPLAVIGFKKGNKVLASLSVVLILASYGLGEMNKAQKGKVMIEASVQSGKEIYASAGCVACHGDDGALGLSGAKSLQASTLTTAEIENIIRNGKNAMPAYKTLTDAQVKALVEHVESLRK
ncbi:SirB2 family protein [Hugenholtzia roseola]|uniref:SirB2 family protein n=1 Tax=Hugenholtzia roseola TaxID=1002 RepID=UPI000426C40F|nr:SirB2 family protein [Hugenholtzia roseola]